MAVVRISDSRNRCKYRSQEKGCNRGPSEESRLEGEVGGQNGCEECQPETHFNSNKAAAKKPAPSKAIAKKPTTKKVARRKA